MRYLVEITKENRGDDVYESFANQYDALIYAGQNSLAPNGYRVFGYEEGIGGALRENSKAVLRVTGESGETAETEFSTLEDAQAAIAELDPSAGYLLFDLEQPLGSAPSLMLGARPNLYAQYDVVTSRPNGHGRTDADRF